MSVTIIQDLAFGDCGKGKVSHFLAQTHDIGLRFNGGPNAGHTIMWGSHKIVTHMLPATALLGKPSYLVPGVLVDPERLAKEVEELKKLKINTDLFWVDYRCPVILEEHRIRDQETGQKVGTTGSGIGPCLADQMNRVGLRYHQINNQPLQSLDTIQLIRWYLNSGRSILCEGAQGHFLDIWHGTYPYVTSSLCTTGAVCTNAGIPPQKIDRVVGVFKAYMTRVGNGPFLTEDKSFLAEKISLVGQEIGATTGRKRRIGWLDLMSLIEACQFNGVTELVITKADVLNNFNKVLLCDNHLGWEGNKTPHYIEFDGWKNLQDIKFFRFIEFIEKTTKIPISFISTGPRTEEMIERK